MVVQLMTRSGFSGYVRKVIRSSYPFNPFVSNTLFYKQLALGGKIVKQISWLNPLSLSNNKNYRLNKSGVFPCQIAVKPTIHQSSAVSKALLGKF